MPITALYAGLLAPLFLLLSVRVIRQRRGVKVAVGDGDRGDADAGVGADRSGSFRGGERSRGPNGRAERQASGSSPHPGDDQREPDDEHGRQRHEAALAFLARGTGRNAYQWHAFAASASA